MPYIPNIPNIPYMPYIPNIPYMPYIPNARIEYLNIIIYRTLRKISRDFK